ncbi:hypothetical protein NQ318_001711 [Aromia moschata]|uniref:Uncharacterized protein n=1 Tax=Aromia moschata TaxID=1265417 RepID=A0AAV8XVB7_9CUCU|nr:hypothetical protein NQ318_001711 [Aromia moschata]
MTTFNEWIKPGEQDQLAACNEQVNLLKQRNSELESDMESCRVREAELLLFTQQLTDKNVRLQSEFTSMETKEMTPKKVQQLSCEQTLLKRQIKEQETKASMLSAKLSEERLKYTEEIESLSKDLSEKTKNCEQYMQEVVDQKGENGLMKRKFEMSLREVNKELQQCRKKLEHFESMEDTSRSSSNSSLSVGDRPTDSDQVKVIQPDAGIDKQTLIEHIVKLQRISAKKSEKLDFLEEHVNTLVMELQKKSRLLQSYILREQSGTLTSNSMDNNKMELSVQHAKLAKLNGVMASLYSSRVADDNLTLELSLDINRKLQAVLEDALLKNITLKENVDTLGSEIDRSNFLFNFFHADSMAVVLDSIHTALCTLAKSPALHHGRGLIIDSYFETCRTPVDKSHIAFRLHLSDGSVDVFWYYVAAVQ